MNETPERQPRDLPIRAVHEPPIDGPHEVVGEPGITHRYVFAGPNATRRPGTATEQPVSVADLAPLADSLNAAPRPRWLRIALRIVDWLLLPVSFIVGVFLTLAWDALDGRARLATAVVVLVAVAGHWAIRHTRRRRVRD